MRVQAIWPRALLALTISLLAAAGCGWRSPIGRVFVYSCDRVMDASDMLDLGLTVTPRFSLSAYACLLGLGGLGYGSVDGYFGGIGGSRVGVFRHYHWNLGVGLYAYEVTGWGDFDTSNSETLATRHRGPIAWVFVPGGDKCVGAG